jgi:hypothetical protein
MRSIVEVLIKTNEKMINWKHNNAEEPRIIAKIAKRACEKFGWLYFEINMDISATHLNGNPLKLKELLTADDLNFSHDLVGIRNHIDRNTGKLKNCFLPRYSAS